MKEAMKFNTSDYVVDKELGLQRGASTYEGIMLRAVLGHEQENALPHGPHSFWALPGL